MKDKCLFFSDIVFWNGNIYFVDSNYLCLWRTDLTFTNYVLVSDLCSLLKDGLDDFLPYRMFLYRNVIYLTSRLGISLLAYDLITRNSRMIKYSKNNCKERYYSFCNDGENIVFISQYPGREIIQFRMKRALFYECLGIECDGNSQFGEKILNDGNLLYIPLVGTDKVYVVNTNNFEHHYFSIGQEGIFGIYQYKEQCIYTMMDGSVLVEDKCIVKCDEKPSEIISLDKEIMILPRSGNKIINYIVDKKSLEYIDIKIPSGSNIREGSSMFYGYYLINERIMLFPWRVPYLYEFDLKEHELKIVEQKKDLPSYGRYIYSKKKSYENGEYAISDFVQCLI